MLDATCLQLELYAAVTGRRAEEKPVHLQGGEEKQQKANSFRGIIHSIRVRKCGCLGVREGWDVLDFTAKLRYTGVPTGSIFSADCWLAEDFPCHTSL